MEQSYLFTNVTLLQEAGEPLRHEHWLRTWGNEVQSLGPMTRMEPSDEATVIDGKGGLLMPGLINGHNHCAMTLFRGLADDLELGAWLNEHIFPAEAAHVTQDMVYWCTKLAAAEMLLSGTTTVADGYFFEDRAAQALLDVGMRAIPAQGVIDFPAPGVPDPADNVATAERFLTDWQGKDDRISPGIFAHSPYTCSPATLQRAKKTARHYQAPLFIHVAESRQEREMLIDARGTSPIRHLAALGLLDEDTVLIHCVWLDEEDRKIIRDSGAGVVVCPQSHFKLASGIARVNEMEALKIWVGLGTDSCASNNSLDLFREMDILAKGQKVRTLDPTAMPASQALAAATTTNGALLGLNGLGRLAPGCKADLQLLDLGQPHLQPCYNADLLVYAARGSDVTTVMVDGKLLVRDRTLLSFDLEETMARVRQLAGALR